MQKSSLQLVSEIIDRNANGIVSINISRSNIESVNISDVGDIEYKLIDVRKWVTDKIHEGGVINIEAIRRESHQLVNYPMVVMNFSGFNSDVVSKVLTHVRIGLSYEKVWPKAMIVICDDNVQLTVAPIVAHAFIQRPGVLVDFTVKRIVRGMERKSRVMRIFGVSITPFAKLFDAYLAWTYRRSDKKLVKETGKAWEE